MTAAAAPLIITRLGAAGDGIAHTVDRKPIFVAGGLPGETVLNAGQGAVQHTSPDRVTPPCPHFGVCGGCIAQHMGDTLYAAWKRDIAVQALAHRSIVAPVERLVRIAPRTRRRATFSLGRAAGDIGFHQSRSDVVVPLTTCTVATPRISAALPGLADLASRLSPTKSRADVRISVADLDGGLDVNLIGVAAPTAAAARADIATSAVRIGLARLAIDGDIILTRAIPRLTTRAGAITPPPGAFFQAVALAESAVVDAVIAGLPKKPKHIADLFSGVGTLSLPLAQHARVHAVDDDAAALAALTAATRATQHLKPIDTRRRDLFREPLSAKELEPFDVVVLDPPRAGAKAQIDILATSGPPTVIMVSCDPGTAARDLRRLIDAGYRLTRVTPIDQFLWSPHVELVATLDRPAKRRR